MERFKTMKKNSKWITTVASIWIQSTSGSLYTFSIYSQLLKSTQHYSQSTLDTVSVFKDLGANSGILAGLLYSYINTINSDSRRHQRHGLCLTGPWVVLLAGAIQCFVGYFVMWLCVVGIISRPPVSVVCLFMLMAAHAQTFFNTGNVVTAIRNFPDFAGTSVGIMKGFLGLSGAILIQVYRTLFKNKPASFLLMLAVFPTINTLLLMCFVRIHDKNEEHEKKYLNGFSLISLVVAAYLMVLIVSENILTFPPSVQIFTLVILILLLASPLYVAIQAHSLAPQRNSGTTLQSSLLDYDHSIDADKEPVPGNASKLSVNLFQAMRSINFWLLFIAMACGLGSGLATVNNISQIGGSLGYKAFETSTLVSLWSIWNFLGRFGAGFISDYFMHIKGWARPLFMVITLSTMCIGHLIIASGLPRALYVGSILVGVCYGSQWSLMPTITSEIFGVTHMGTIFNTISMASPLGSYILSVRVVGFIYDREASTEGNVCAGNHCFMLSFLIMAFVALFGSFAALLLFLRTKSFYDQVVIRRLQHEQSER